MSESKLPRFRWWYLLLLLPVLLYLGARWWVDNKIESLIEQANTEGNQLTVADYSFSLIPAGLEVEGVEFDQEGQNFTAAGKLSRGKISGLKLFSLIGSDPIKMDSLVLSGLDARASRTATPPGSNDTFRLSISAIRLDSTFLEFSDQPKGRGLRLNRLGLLLTSFQLPFQPEGIKQLEVYADSTLLYDNRSQTRLTTSEIDYDRDRASILVNTLRLTRGADRATDLNAKDITFSGFNQYDLGKVIKFDSITIAQLGGRAQVRGNPQKKDDEGVSARLLVGKLALPDTEVSVSGDFGTVDFDGTISADELDLLDTFQLSTLRIDGRRVNFTDPDKLNAVVSNVSLRQGRMALPGVAGSLGTTDLDIPSLDLEVQGSKYSLRSLHYSSTDGDLSADDFRITTGKLSGTAGSVALSGIDRDALLDGSAPRIGAARADQVSIRISQKEGGYYLMRAPTVTADQIAKSNGWQIATIEVDGGEIRRTGSSGKEDLVVSNLYIDQRNLSFPFSAASLGASRVSASRVHLRGEKESLDYNGYNLLYSSNTRQLTVDSFNRNNRYTPHEYFANTDGNSWLNFGFDSIAVTGLDHREFLAGKLVKIDSMFASDFELMVVEYVAKMEPTQRKMMPIEALRALGPRIVLKGARLDSTKIAYGIVDSILDPKTIHFDRGTITLSGLDTKLSDKDSVRLAMDATFEKTTPVHAEFALARDSSGRNYAMRGEMGSYDLSRINPLMRIAADAIVEQGQIEKMTYNSEMKGGVVSGNMRFYYHDLDLKLVGGVAFFKNLLSGLVLKDSNEAGEDFRPGRMYHEHDPKRSFFNAYWKGLVSGMKSSALSDIALPDELEGG